MLSYQERYIENAREIAVKSVFTSGGAAIGFDAWYEERRQARERIAALRSENISLLSSFLFPMLDDLFSATAEDIEALEEFSDRLMDWKANLDCGVYVAIHDALLSLYRIRRERGGVIKELYKLGMGVYYLRRFLLGVEEREAYAFAFQNEMLFTEAGSYIRFFESIESEETKGYIIRALANVAMCAQGYKRRISTSAHILRIAKDEHYRSLAPSLPWDTFVRRTHQQMSSNRNELSRGSLSSEELATVLDSCYEVFKPEESAENPSVRWLWPYYEMEYNCGYVSLEVTLERLRKLVEQTRFDEYDMSGMYGNVQLPIYCGRLMKEHVRLQGNEELLHFLDWAYRKMLRTLLSCPPQQMDDYFFYCVCQVVSDFFEIDGLLPYREVVGRLMPRFAGESYVRARRAGALMRAFAEAIFEQDKSFFDDIPSLREYTDEAGKKRALLELAESCGMYMDFGQLKMNISRTMQTRTLFEDEFRMFRLHAISGWKDLQARSSTRAFADTALGHHSWYNGAGGYPDEYERNASPYRQMTDIAAVVSFLLEREGESLEEAVAEAVRQERRRFSPLVTAYLRDAELIEALREAMQGDERARYRDIYQTLYGETT